MKTLLTSLCSVFLTTIIIQVLQTSANSKAGRSDAEKPQSITVLPIDLPPLQPIPSVRVNQDERPLSQIQPRSGIVPKPPVVPVRIQNPVADEAIPSEIHETIRSTWRPGVYMNQAFEASMAAGLVGYLSDENLGFMNIPFLGAFIHPKRYAFVDLHLKAGIRYAFIGSGDSNAIDVDIVIRNSQGKAVQHDTKRDRTPVVFFTPSESGIYQMRLQLYEGKAASFCGVVLLSDDGYLLPIKSLLAAKDNLISLCSIVNSEVPIKFHDEPGEWGIISNIVPAGESEGFSDLVFGKGYRGAISVPHNLDIDIDSSLTIDGSRSLLVTKDDEPRPTAVLDFVSDSRFRYTFMQTNASSSETAIVMSAFLHR